MSSPLLIALRPVKTVFLATLLAVASFASSPVVEPVYLSADVSKYLTLLPPPPSNDSPAGQADLFVVLRLQAARTPAQEARVKELADHTPFQMGALAFGPEFNAENLPVTDKFFKAVRAQSRPAILSTKSNWNRTRPYLRGVGVEPCAPKPKSSSYPSGHSLEAALWAALLTAAFPEHAEVFAVEVQDTMWSRIVGGVHYPSDTQAGLKVGLEIARDMLASEDMAAALEAIRAEVAALPTVRPAISH
jgi:acid phosphatase (class A)